MTALPPLGATVLDNDRVRFHLWAPFAKNVEVALQEPEARTIRLTAGEGGYFIGVAEDCAPGTNYFYQWGDKERWPDPASRYQPQGVHGPSQVIRSDFAWEDQAWEGAALQDYLIYELHVGTFTPEGTFEAILPHLPSLRDLGITALELMPVAQFPGERNWGYDGVFPFAVQHSYGGPESLKKLVNACHQSGLAVILDVVYNHLGPEGNYFKKFGPYFTDRYRGPWGEALNFDGPQSDPVRHYFLENARYWIREFHFDALRIDAIHGIYDFSAMPFLAELAETIQAQHHELKRKIYAIAESDLNDVKVIRSRAQGGYGFDAQWSDDFHHALHTLLTGEKEGYYQDFGNLDQLAKAYREGFVYSGQYSPYRRRRHGNDCRDFPAERFVVFSQNHDQTGNRLKGERLSQLTPFEAQKLAAAAVLFSPYLPLLFMGEEYGETAPFPYFISHTDSKLVQAVREGRKSDFQDFSWKEEPPDPQDEATFLSAKLKRHHGVLWKFYQELIRLRKEVPASVRVSKKGLTVERIDASPVLSLVREAKGQAWLALLLFDSSRYDLEWAGPGGTWKKVLDSSQDKWEGPGESLPRRIAAGKVEPLSFPPWSASWWIRED